MFILQPEEIKESKLLNCFGVFTLIVGGIAVLSLLIFVSVLLLDSCASRAHAQSGKPNSITLKFDGIDDRATGFDIRFGDTQQAVVIPGLPIVNLGHYPSAITLTTSTPTATVEHIIQGDQLYDEETWVAVRAHAPIDPITPTELSWSRHSNEIVVLYRPVPVTILNIAAEGNGARLTWQKHSNSKIIGYKINVNGSRIIDILDPNITETFIPTMPIGQSTVTLAAFRHDYKNPPEKVFSPVATVTIDISLGSPILQIICDTCP